MTAATTALSLKESTKLQITLKGDGSPVTSADTAAELLVRELINAACPGDYFLGEETGGLAGREGRVWIVDPIDGTKNFIRGLPIWASLVALVEDGRPKVGVVYAPDLKRCWWGEKEGGAYVAEVPGGEAQRIQVGESAQLRDAYISTTAYDTWQRYGLHHHYQRLAELTYCNRGFGDFFQHCLVAEGVLDAALEPVVAPWDVAALVPIVEEAGGRCTDLGGHPILADKRPGIVSANRPLHERVVDLFGE